VVKYKLNKNVKIRKEDDDVFLIYVPKYRNLLITNTTGYEIIYLLKEGKNTDNILSLMKQKYKVDSKTLENDLKTFLKKCEDWYIIFGE